MTITLDKTIRPSKLQPMIFSLARQFAKKKKEDFRAVISQDNKVMCVIVTPILFEEYLKLKRIIEEVIEEIEDEEDAKRVRKILKENPNPKWIPAEEVYKEAGLI